MPTRARVESLLEEGQSYETAGRALHVPPGQAYMTATGESDEHLVDPPPVDPTRNASTMEWVRERAARELRPSR